MCDMKLRFYTIFVKSVVLYGAEVWSAMYKTKLLATKMTYLRHSFW